MPLPSGVLWPPGFADLDLAPYLNNKLQQSGQEEPAVEDADDYKSLLPPLVSGPGLKIRIPPELMPDDETTLQYFELYFANAHPYVPVLDKQKFYQQWQNDRESVSPLLVEAIFSISGRLADEPAQGQQWLALATSKLVNKPKFQHSQLERPGKPRSVPETGFRFC